MRDAITAQEAYYVDNESYAECLNDVCETTLPGFVSGGNDVVAMWMETVNSGADFAAQSESKKANPTRCFQFFTYSSNPASAAPGKIFVRDANSNCPSSPSS